MRLDAIEKNALRYALRDVNDEVYLFGSRTDDTKKGGDIDVLIFSNEDPYRLSKRVAVSFFMECEEKIDVVVMNPEQLSREDKAFLKSIQKVRFQ